MKPSEDSLFSCFFVGVFSLLIIFFVTVFIVPIVSFAAAVPSQSF